MIFGVVNPIVRPIVSLSRCRSMHLHPGLFTLIINAAMLALTVWLTSFLPMYVVIDSFFWTAILAALIISHFDHHELAGLFSHQLEGLPSNGTGQPLL